MSGVSIVLGSYNRKHFLVKTIESVRVACKDIVYEILVVDGGSDDGTLNWLLKQKDIITIVQHNRGIFKGVQIKRKSWGYFMNLAFKSAQYKFILMISDDCLLHKHAVVNALNKFEIIENNGEKIGAMPFYWRNWPEQNEYVVGFTFGKLFLNHGLYLRTALEEIGFADEKNFNFYYGDGDLSLRLWSHGYFIIESETSFIEHFSHANQAVRKSNLEKERLDFTNYTNRWKNYFQGDDIVDYDWKYQKYDDINKTYKNFPLYSRLMVSLNFFILKLKKITKTYI
jgi:glycosyltransferase involved in cell wall biosynthesis